jgi:hypothetical protein
VCRPGVPSPACCSTRAREYQIALSLARCIGFPGAGRVESRVTRQPIALSRSDHVAHVLLGEIRIGATRAAGNTVEAGPNTALERVAILDGRLWIHQDDLWKVHVSPSHYRG